MLPDFQLIEKADHPRPDDKKGAVAWARQLLGRDDWAILDTETTGLDEHSEVIQIAILSPDNEVLLNTYVRPLHTTAIPEAATAVHGITIGMLEHARSMPELMPRLKEILESRQIIAYNAGYDARLLRQTIIKNGDGGCFFSLDFDCAMVQYARYAGEWVEAKGDYRWPRLPSGDHSALGDCRATLALIRKMANCADFDEQGAPAIVLRSARSGNLPTAADVPVVMRGPQTGDPGNRAAQSGEDGATTGPHKLPPLREQSSPVNYAKSSAPTVSRNLPKPTAKPPVAPKQPDKLRLFLVIPTIVVALCLMIWTIDEKVRRAQPENKATDSPSANAILHEDLRQVWNGVGPDPRIGAVHAWVPVTLPSDLRATLVTTVTNENTVSYSFYLVGPRLLLKSIFAQPNGKIAIGFVDSKLKPIAEVQIKDLLEDRQGDLVSKSSFPCSAKDYGRITNWRVDISGFDSPPPKAEGTEQATPIANSKTTAPEPSPNPTPDMPPLAPPVAKNNITPPLSSSPVSNPFKPISSNSPSLSGSPAMAPPPLIPQGATEPASSDGTVAPAPSNRLNKLEESIFGGASTSTATIYQRLDKLEDEVFKQRFPDKSVSERLDGLQKTVFGQ